MTPRSGSRAGGRSPITRRSPGSASTCSRRRAWRRTCSTRSCTCARAPGWGGWAWWPATGSRSPRTPRKRPAGPRPGCASSPRRSWTAPEGRGRRRGAGTAAAGHGPAARREIVPDPRSRAGRIAACLEELQGEREAAQVTAREHGQAYLEALAAGTANGRPPAAAALAAWQLRLEQVIAAQQALIDDWQAAVPPEPGPGSAAAPRTRSRPPRRAAPEPGWRTCRPPRRPRPPERERGKSRSATSPTRTPG